jgi:hypothetical protein
VYLIRLVSANPRIYLFVVSLFFPIGLYLFLDDSELDIKGILISIVIIFTFGIFDFALSGVRQTIAMSILLFGFRFIKRKKFIPYLICVLFAALFHTSALIGLILYFIKNLKLGWAHGAIFLVVVIVILLAPQSIINFIQKTIFSEAYGQYGTTYVEDISLTMFFIFIAFSVFPLWHWKKLKDENYSLLHANSGFLAMSLQVCTGIIAEFFRLAMYFSPSIAVLFPKPTDKISDEKVKVFINGAVVCVCIAYMLFFQGGTFANYAIGF